MRFFLLLVGSIFLGCGGTTATPTKAVQQKTKHLPEKRKNTKNCKKVLPKWIKNPDFNKNIGAVGVVKLNKNKKKQKYIAKRLAVAQLMERKSVQVESSYSSKQTNKQTKHTQTIQEHSDGTVVDEFEVKGEYSDAKNYYIWVVIKK